VALSYQDVITAIKDERQEEVLLMLVMELVMSRLSMIQDFLLYRFKFILSLLPGSPPPPFYFDDVIRYSERIFSCVANNYFFGAGNDDSGRGMMVNGQ
jgi:hypothetical protein